MNLRSCRHPAYAPILAIGLCLTACGSTARADLEPAAGVAVAAASASDTAAVIAVAQRLFDAMATRDTAALRQLLLPEGSFVVLVGGADSTRVAVTPLEGFIERIGRPGPDLEERMWQPRVFIDGPLAVVWTAYDFHIGGEFSHCGTDAFTLAHTASGWRITGGSYTIQQTDCPERAGNQRNP